MDRTEPAATAAAPAGPQSRIPAIVFWILAAAIALRIVTAFAGRDRVTETAGLVRWTPANRALALSAASRRPVLYDFTAAWCPPCRRLDHEGWEDDEVAARISNSFIPARIVDRQREDGKNPDAIEALQKRYKVDVFPTLIAADTSGREIARMTGYAGRAQLDAFLKETNEKIRANPSLIGR
ncbi:MAG: thioredoxin fold domain-containing protein [Acidobacteriota bacterium]|nr:thioredoxin fold domain-containing protein [Acidobacteriota bacterium]